MNEFYQTFYMTIIEPETEQEPVWRLDVLGSHRYFARAIFTGKTAKNPDGSVQLDNGSFLFGLGNGEVAYGNDSLNRYPEYVEVSASVTGLERDNLICRLRQAGAKRILELDGEPPRLPLDISEVAEICNQRLKH